jgi:hypothetical protein
MAANERHQSPVSARTTAATEQSHASLLLACAAATLGGCSTIASDRLDSYQASPAAAGVTYFLPMRLVKITVTRTPVNLAEFVKKRDAKRAAAEAAKTTLSEATGKRERAQALLDALDSAAPNRTAVSGNRDIAVAEEKIAKQAADDLTVQADDLSAAVVAIETGGVACTSSAKIELLPAQADPDQRFVAQFRHNIFRDDTVTLKVSPAGLLTSTNVVAADRTSDIIVEAAGALSGIQAAKKMEAWTSSDRQAACAALPRQFVQILDPVAGATVSSLPGIAKVNADLKTADFPFRLTADVSAVVRTTADTSQRRLAGAADYAPDGAIYYRSAIPMLLTLEQCAESNAVGTCTKWQATDAAVVTLPQAGPVTYIPMNSAIFVRTVNDVQFTDGSISSWSAERPSEALEIVRLPVKVLTAVVSVPAQLLSLRVDYSSKEKSLADAQQAEIASADRLRLLKACLKQAETQNTPTSACFTD